MLWALCQGYMQGIASAQERELEIPSGLMGGADESEWTRIYIIVWHL